MIVITGKSGQLGNSLILYANFIVFGIENRVKIYNPSFYRYSAYFTFTDQFNKTGNKFIFLLLYYFTRILIKLRVKNAKALDWHEKINLDNSSELNDFNRPFYFVQGWNYRANQLLEKNKALILKHFRPQDIYLQQLDLFFKNNFNPGHETLVGLHIRRGDYKNFEGGKYFYSLAQYISVITKISALFNHKVRFLICSNEKFDAADFGAAQATITFAPGHELLDLYALARCSYIAGPPSTYSMWASFYGSAPLCMLHEVDREILLTDFKIQTHF